MKTLVINGNRFSLESESHAFLTSYMKRLETYIVAHRLDKQLYEDVLSGIEEKLGAIDGNISQKHCVDIVNALGEPEDIFEGEEASDTPLTPTSKRKYRPRINIGLVAFWTIVFVVFVLGGEHLPGPIAFLLVLALIGSIGYVLGWMEQIATPSALPRMRIGIGAFWAMSGFGVILAIADGMPVLAGLVAFVVIFFLAKYSLHYEKAGTLIKKDFGTARKAISRISNSVWGLATRTFRNLLTVGRMILFGGVGVCLFLIALCALILVGGYLVGGTFDNVAFFALVPKVAPVAGIVGAVSLVVLGILSLMWAISKKAPHIHYLMGAGVGLVVALVLSSITGFSVFQAYLGQPSHIINRTLSIEVTPSDTVYDIVSYKMSHNPLWSWGNVGHATILPSDDNMLKIETETERRGPDNLREDIEKAIIPYEFTKKKDSIHINTPKKIFRQKTPFVPLQSRITKIYIPKNIKFDIYRHREKNIFPETAQKYSSFFSPEEVCAYYFYDEKQKDFVCKIDEKKLQKWIDASIVPTVVRNSISYFSPLKHKEKYKRTYHDSEYGYYNGDYVSDRQVQKITRDNNNKLTITYRDKSLIISATATLKEHFKGETLTGAALLVQKEGGIAYPPYMADFTITKIVKDGDKYRDEYYTNPELVKAYLKE